MKKVHLPVILMAVLFNTALFAQKDTIFTSVTQETGAMERQQFVSEYDAVFGAMRPAKWMFYSNVAKILASDWLNPDLNLGAALKLSNSIAVGLQYDYSANSVFRSEGRNHQLSANIRWYYNMGRRIAEGRSVSNFSGNYIALGQSVVYDERVNDVVKTETSLRFGIQRRILKYGYFDFSYGLGYSPAIKYRDRTLSILPSTSIGFALFTPRKSAATSGSACDVLKCFQETKHMLKFDIYNLVQAGSISPSFVLVTVNPSVAYEQKIGKSPFSVEVEGKGQFAYFNRDNGGAFGYSRQGGIAGAGELRWYFLQKKRILQGRSGNNLSGIFAALNGSYGINKGIYGPYTFENYTAKAMGIIGVQYRIFDHGFVQFKYGLGCHWIRATNVNTLGERYDSGYDPDFRGLTEVKVGFAF